MATGLRQAELLGLRWEDVDLDKGIITIKQTIMRQRKYDEDGGRPAEGEEKTEIIRGKPKTKKGYRVIPLQESILKKLKAHELKQKEEKLKVGTLWQNSDLVFTSEIGTNVESRRLLNVFHSLLKSRDI